MATGPANIKITTSVVFQKPADFMRIDVVIDEFYCTNELAAELARTLSSMVPLEVSHPSTHRIAVQLVRDLNNVALAEELRKRMQVVYGA